MKILIIFSPFLNFDPSLPTLKYFNFHEIQYYSKTTGRQSTVKILAKSVNSLAMSQAQS